jgi:hypothetical protein
MARRPLTHGDFLVSNNGEQLIIAVAFGCAFVFGHRGQHTPKTSLNSLWYHTTTLLEQVYGMDVTKKSFII